MAPPPSSAQPSSVAQPTGAPGHLLQEGDRAPNITVRAHNGQELNFSTFRSKPVVVYFYPRDDTPGCTTEAQGFRDSWGEIEKAGALVVGVSTDDNTSHQAFAKKYELPFPLLADTDQKLADAFGVKVWANYAERVTFVIDRSGKVAKVFPKVVPKNHAAEVMAVLHALN
ncbi:MAG TPA: peroxiredoxin [Polyangiaceae bacterium]